MASIGRIIRFKEEHGAFAEKSFILPRENICYFMKQEYILALAT